MLDDVARLLSLGGAISWVLVGVSGLMWTVATLRWLQLTAGFSGPVAALVQTLAATPSAAGAGVVPRFVVECLHTMHHPGACGHDLDRWLVQAQRRAESYGAILQSLVTAAPLLGLLGTVSGMVETFGSMHDVSGGHATEHTVAGGISVALITTQLGLAIGVPGLIAARLLTRLEARRRAQIVQARAILGARLPEGAA